MQAPVIAGWLRYGSWNVFKGDERTIMSPPIQAYTGLYRSIRSLVWLSASYTLSFLVSEPQHIRHKNVRPCSFWRRVFSIALVQPGRFSNCTSCTNVGLIDSSLKCSKRRRWAKWPSDWSSTGSELRWIARWKSNFPHRYIIKIIKLPFSNCPSH